MKTSDTKKDWLELGDNDDPSEAFFQKDLDKKFQKNIYDSKKGKILLDLQKSFKGDDRFHLNKSFKNDIEFDKLPNMVKLANRELQYDLNDSEKKEKKHNETDLDREKNGQLSILKNMFPKEKINSEAKKIFTKNLDSLIVPRFDPTKAQCKNLIIDDKITKNKKKGGENKFKMASGIDKKKKNILKAQAILKETISKPNTVDRPKKKIKKIDYQAWKKLIQEPKFENDKVGTLFSK